MSSILIGGDTSGAITISAPAVSGTTTLTLPAVSGTILQSGTVVTVAQGGTGVTTSTGSGANVLGTSPTLTTPTISTTIQNSSGRPILNQTGGVLQVVTFVTNTNFSTASSTPTDTQLTLSITLSSTSSKVLVLIHHADAGKAENAINGSVRLVRDGVTVFTPTGTIGRSDTTATNFSGGFDFHYLDSPATSGAVTYKTQAWTAENTTRFYLGPFGAQHSITLMEIAA